MAISYVSLVCDLFDGEGSPVETGKITFTPTVTLTGTADHITITRAPVVVSLSGSPSPAVRLAATDNVSLSPSGWSWVMTFQFPGAPPPKTFLLPLTSGSTQYLSVIGVS